MLKQSEKNEGEVRTVKCDGCRKRLIDLMTFERSGRIPSPTVLILHCIDCSAITEVGVITTRFGIAPATVYDATDNAKPDSTRDVSEIVEVKVKNGIQTVKCQKLIDSKPKVG